MAQAAFEAFRGKSFTIVDESLYQDPYDFSDEDDDDIEIGSGGKGRSKSSIHRQEDFDWELSILKSRIEENRRAEKRFGKILHPGDRSSSTKTSSNASATSSFSSPAASSSSSSPQKRGAKKSSNRGARGRSDRKKSSKSSQSAKQQQQKQKQKKKKDARQHEQRISDRINEKEEVDRERTRRSLGLSWSSQLSDDPMAYLSQSERARAFEDNAATSLRSLIAALCASTDLEKGSRPRGGEPESEVRMAEVIGLLRDGSNLRFEVESQTSLPERRAAAETSALRRMQRDDGRTGPHRDDLDGGLIYHRSMLNGSIVLVERLFDKTFVGYFCAPFVHPRFYRDSNASQEEDDLMNLALGGVRQQRLQELQDIEREYTENEDSRRDRRNMSSMLGRKSDQEDEGIQSCYP